ncbi:DNA mismatch repair protein MutS [Caldanaerobius fijiensis DSM 17918]|uniref:DNA mismatch repair protein MutS n=1 Tax=Caldanaerobius fijiensis DSM 17918 TaxID=1121256 RepID=A0A1M4YEV1_9THEO|nr:DNA mismatch repair protein MutS [Caldanaerobius fijiensis]SHF04265.1 DNA mismatch repair protein MutS [Caldanaerobius fijiensis DSM 17918]
MTPLIEQYLDIKKQYKDSILFFRVGDFYEMFFQDAEVASKELDIVLTGKDCGTEERVPMAGIPFHSADSYISRLVAKGYKVAICEQMEDPKEAKGLVKRSVIKVITSGTIIDTAALDETSNNYLMSIYIDDGKYGLSSVDITTGELMATELASKEDLLNELIKFKPVEIITNKPEELESLLNYGSFVHKWDFFDYNIARDEIIRKFNVNSLEGLGLKYYERATRAIGALFMYIKATQMVASDNISEIKLYTISDYMIMDKNTINNLELLETYRSKEKKGSLLWVINKTSTPMGSRLIKKWLERPLLNIDEINKRLDAVEELVNNDEMREKLKACLKKIRDFERIMGRIVYKSANGRDLLFFNSSIVNLPEIKNIIQNAESDYLKELFNEIDPLEDVSSLIDSAISYDAPMTINDGNIIKDGYNEEVDKYRKASTEGKNWLAQLESEEREKTGIKNLKIKFNKVFGYYIEVTKSNIDMVPDYFIRKQTLANCERYVTEKLKEIENDILGAEEKVKELEYQLFVEIREKVAQQYKRVKASAEAIAQIDVLTSMAEVAKTNGYQRPILVEEKVIDIKVGRHPVIEKISDDIFVPNDTYMDTKEHMISLITGPNMAGKSTYMRQIALIVILAQMGSFVPADSAKIGIVDRIYTRIGATDDLSTGQSTFMVEMNEVANIVNNATDKSLIILDEVGRGTSTYDGISIAWAVVEYIAKKIKARTLFATHYHELVDIADELKCVKNYNIAVKEEDDKVVFLRKIMEGPTDKSYGIQVAKLAGLPETIIKKANQKLVELEKKHIYQKDSVEPIKQISIFDIGFDFKYYDLIEEIKSLDIDNMTPLQAINQLYKLKRALCD